MKRRPLTDLMPPWTEPSNPIGICVALLIFSAICSLGSYCTRLNAALCDLRVDSWYYAGYVVTGDPRLDPNAVMADFVTLLGEDVYSSVYVPFLMVLVAAIVLGLYHYQGFSQGSKALYLMKRLPDRWELARRCWAVPALTLLVTLAVMVLLTLGYWAAYLLSVPEGYLQGAQWEDFWPHFFTLFNPFSLF